MRRAFTLLEILVVLTVITILTGLGLKATFITIENAKRSSTESQLFRWHVIAQHQQERADRLISRFPSRLTDEVAVLKKIQTWPTATDTQLAVIARKTFMSSKMFALDTTDDPDLTLVDAWGHPIRLYMYNTRFLRENGEGSPLTPNDILRGQKLLGAAYVPQSVLKDADDPLGLLAGLQGFEATFHTPCTAHMIMFVSAGPDGQLGLYEPSDNAHNGHLAAPISGQEDSTFDNLYSVVRQ